MLQTNKVDIWGQGSSNHGRAAAAPLAHFFPLIPYRVWGAPYTLWWWALWKVMSLSGNLV